MSASGQKTRQNAAMADIRVVGAVLRRWDPVNIEPDIGAPAAEYGSYASRIVSMVKGDSTAEVLALHLEGPASETMAVGLSSALSQADSLKFTAEIVWALRPSNNLSEPAHEG